MYEPALFRVEEKAELIAFLRAYPLGLVIAQGAEGLSADLIPFLVDDEGLSLRAHFARANPLLSTLATPQRVLVVFNGPQAYVRPGYYPSKAEHGRVVPTWNYAMVQASGMTRLHEDSGWIAGQVADLTAQQEAGQPEPWTPTDAPKDYIQAQMGAIVGLEIEISELRGKYKLSQNRSEPDRRGVLAGLAQEKSHKTQAAAELMAARRLSNGPEAQR